MRHVAPAAIPRAQNKPPHNFSPLVVLLERQLHAEIIGAAAPETTILRVRLQSHRLGHFVQIRHHSWLAIICSSLLRYLITLLARYFASHLFKPKPRGFARPGALRAGACAFPLSAGPPR